MKTGRLGKNNQSHVKIRDYFLNLTYLSNAEILEHQGFNFMGSVEFSTIGFIRENLTCIEFYK